MLVLGQPAKPVRRLTPAETHKIQAQVEELYLKASEYRAMAAANGKPA
jgi:carbonic anhydrase/acetyltransferase-like protein (isoleucine patch superfamily)